MLARGSSSPPLPPPPPGARFNGMRLGCRVSTLAHAFQSDSIFILECTYNLHVCIYINIYIYMSINNTAGMLLSFELSSSLIFTPASADVYIFSWDYGM